MQQDRVITVIGAHAEGEVGRVITGGVLSPRGNTMFERMQNLERHDSWLRNMLLFDPRGSVNASVNLITPPCDPAADFGMIVMESEYFAPMSGSNLICTVTVALETGMIPMRGPETIIRVDTPAGLIQVEAECRDAKYKRVSFRNIPSFVMHRDYIIDLPGVGALRVDVAYGGLMYCIVEASDLDFNLDRSEARALVDIGEKIKAASASQIAAVHPENSAINTINMVEFTGPLEIIDGVKTSKNAVVVSPGRLNRCPCGTGTSARMALLHARGDLSVGEKFRHLSVLDTAFECRIIETVKVGSIPAITPLVSGRAWLTGVSHYGVDPDDPFPEGYRLSDTWFS
jgi:proline racemase